MTLYRMAPAAGLLADETTGGDLDPALNFGLLYQRYVRQGRKVRQEDADKDSVVRQAIESLVRVFSRCAPEGQRYLDQWHARAERLGGATIDLELQGPLAAGLGNDHPLENGLTLHHTSGVPFVPGTSLKGLMASWWQLCELTDAQDRFGFQSDGEAGRGDTTWLDAMPLTWPVLRPDIINNHLRAYYEGKGNPGAVPFESPVPAFLLTVAPGTRFRFRVLGPAADQAIGELAQALDTLGVGARKANGYGVFGAVRGAR